MRLTLILTLGLGVWGPMLIDAEKIVFVVPRYIKRSYNSNSSPFYSQGGVHGYKFRPPIRGPKRPYFSGHYGANSVKNEPFFRVERPRLPQSGDDFDPSTFPGAHRVVNHVVIPHGKGISHGISFGKGYIPHDEFKNGNNEEYEFPNGNINNLEYADQNQNHQGNVKFEDEDFSGFQNHEQGSGPRNVNWPYGARESDFASANYEQEANQKEPQLELRDGYRIPERPSSNPEEELFRAKIQTNVEKPPSILEENGSSGRISSVLPTAAPLIMMERKLEPIILRDTIDMKEYVEKVEAFSKSWPPAASLQGFNWQNQNLNPSGLTIPNYQGFNFWASNLPRNPNGGYEVQEDSVEEPNRRSFRRIMM